MNPQNAYGSINYALITFRCVPVEDKCSNVTCPPNAHCEHHNNSVRCECDPGTISVNNRCIDAAQQEDHSNVDAKISGVDVEPPETVGNGDDTDSPVDGITESQYVNEMKKKDSESGDITIHDEDLASTDHDVDIGEAGSEGESYDESLKNEGEVLGEEEPNQNNMDSSLVKHPTGPEIITTPGRTQPSRVIHGDTPGESDSGDKSMTENEHKDDLYNGAHNRSTDDLPKLDTNSSTEETEVIVGGSSSLEKADDEQSSAKSDVIGYPDNVTIESTPNVSNNPTDDATSPHTPTNTDFATTGIPIEKTGSTVDLDRTGADGSLTISGIDSPFNHGGTSRRPSESNVPNLQSTGPPEKSQQTDVGYALSNTDQDSNGITGKQARGPGITGSEESKYELALTKKRSFKTTATGVKAAIHSISNWLPTTGTGDDKQTKGTSASGWDHPTSVPEDMKLRVSSQSEQKPSNEEDANCSSDSSDPDKCQPGADGMNAGTPMNSAGVQGSPISITERKTTRSHDNTNDSQASDIGGLSNPDATSLHPAHSQTAHAVQPEGIVEDQTHHNRRSRRIARAAIPPYHPLTPSPPTIQLSRVFANHITGQRENGPSHPQAVSRAAKGPEQMFKSFYCEIPSGYSDPDSYDTDGLPDYIQVEMSHDPAQGTRYRYRYCTHIE
ncbi:immediate early protein, putative [Babesia caballi]|uniref:Immediate early protein, putative n=1 Tax=Babesia caballi TaxID=5871 RepID=A0AAV4LV24_BABCB|nr:immediate early protein, putative [Babesia caballi]